MTLTPALRKSREGRRTDCARLEQQLQDLSAQYLQRCAETALRDEKHAVMAKLYAGAKRLHQAVLEGAAAEAIVDIGSNLMGCEQMALIIAREKGNRIAFIGSVGLDRKQLTAIRKNAKAILEVVSTEIYMTRKGEKPDPFLSSLGITAFVPFSFDDTTKGAIVFFGLLPQRNGLDATDRELLTLLSAYAGPCLSTGKGKDQETFE